MNKALLEILKTNGVTVFQKEGSSENRVFLMPSVYRDWESLNEKITGKCKHDWNDDLICSKCSKHIGPAKKAAKV